MGIELRYRNGSEILDSSSIAREFAEQVFTDDIVRALAPKKEPEVSVLEHATRRHSTCDGDRRSKTRTTSNADDIAIGILAQIGAAVWSVQGEPVSPLKPIKQHGCTCAAGDPSNLEFPV
jgi:hypothetical protein